MQEKKLRELFTRMVLSLGKQLPIKLSNLLSRLV